MADILTPNDILSIPSLHAGTVRSHINHPDGLCEGTAINNLIAIHGIFCVDFAGNKFGSYTVVPTTFWRHIRKELAELHGRDWRLLAKNPHGGYMGVLSGVTIYVEEVSVVVLKPDQGELVFEFSVGNEHEILLSKEQLIKEYGYEKVGYDTRLTFVPWWESRGCAYAPIAALLEWAETDGYKPAVALLANPSQAALNQWYNQGQIQAPVKEAVVALIEGREYYPQISARVIEE